MVFLPMFLGFGSCSEVDQEVDQSAADGIFNIDSEEMASLPAWPAMTLVAREGMAVLEIDDDEVSFEGVPFEGTVPIWTGTKRVSGTPTYRSTVAGRKVTLVIDGPSGTMDVSVGDLRFVVARGGAEVSFDGRRARLANGAKRAVFTKSDGVEISGRK